MQIAFANLKAFNPSLLSKIKNTIPVIDYEVINFEEEEEDFTDSEEYKKNKMFKNPLWEIIGLVVIFFTLLISNAGGISGADTNIPLMLVFHEIFY